MLRNDPPAWTRVRFLQSVRHAPRGAIGRLVAHGRYEVERPDDVFNVEYRGQTPVFAGSPAHVFLT